MLEAHCVSYLFVETTLRWIVGELITGLQEGDVLEGRKGALIFLGRPSSLMLSGEQVALCGEAKTAFS